MHEIKQKLKDTSIELHKYRLVLDQAPVAVYMINKEMRFEYVNRSFTTQSGYTREELLNNHINEAIYKNWGEIPETRRHIVEALARGETWEGELLSNHKDGHNYWANTIASPYKNENGEVDGYMIIQQDITEQKKLEILSRESENLYRTLIENSLDAVVLTQDFKFIYYNQVFLQMLGYSDLEMKLVDPLSILAPEDKERIMNYHLMRMKGEIFEQDYVANFLRKDGSKFTAEMKATSVTYKGKAASFITMRDITERERIKNELEQSSRRFRDLAEMLPQTVYELDINGRQTYMNKAGLKTFGHHGDAIGHLAYNSIAPEDHPRMRENMIKSMQKDKDYSIGNEYTAVKQDGTRFPIMVYAAPIVSKDEVIGTRGIIIDISERKAMENALRESEAKYKTLVENSLEGISIVRDNRYLYANTTYCKMLGYSLEELKEMPAMQSIHPDDRPKALKLAERRQRQDFWTVHEEFRLVSKSGEVRECETSSTLVEYGGIWASFFTSHDITESKRMQAALAKSERRFRELTEMLPQAIYELDTNNMPTFMNKTGLEMFMLGDMNFTGKKAYDFFSPEDTLRMKEALESEAQKTENIEGETRALASRPMEYTAYRTDGTSFPVIIYGAPILENGEIKGSRGIIIDISERKAIEDELRQSEEKYRLLFEAESDAIFMIDTESGDILDVNPAATRTYGYSREEFLKMKNIEVSAEPEKTIEATKRRDTNVMLRFHRKKDQTIFPVELSSGFTVFKGRKIQIVTSRDITENKKMQDALLESEEKYRTLIENATDGIVIAQEGILKFANQAMCEIMQYPLGGLIDKPYLEFVVPDDHQTMIDMHQRRMSGNWFTSIYRSRFIRKDGKLITVELNARTSQYNGKPAAFVIIRDITERLKAETDLQIAKNELEQLNLDLEKRIIESSEKLADARTQLLNLQKENLQSQFEVLRQQVNPHFLFNSLNVLTSLIKLEPDLAEQFSEHLSKVYRYVLENKDNEFVDLNTELRFLDAYIFLLNIRFVGKIKVNINIPELKRGYLIIPLAMQLLIENAIKHNIMTKAEPLIIDIFIDENNYLNIVNNLQERPSHLVSTGVGLKNIQNRYLLLINTEAFFEKTTKQFIAKIPLIKEYTNKNI